MTTARELLPCPFCGSAPKSDTGFSPNENQLYVWCSNEECVLFPRITEVLIRPEEWNRRSAYDAKARECEELRKEVDRLLNMEMERILIASEDEIRREILADGRDPNEYLRAIDTSLKCAMENAILTVGAARSEEEK